MPYQVLRAAGNPGDVSWQNQVWLTFPSTQSGESGKKTLKVPKQGMSESSAEPVVSLQPPTLFFLSLIKAWEM